MFPVALRKGLVVVGLAMLPGRAETQSPPRASSSDILSRLPDDIEKKNFIIDCSNCHQFSARYAFDSAGQPRTAAQWEAIVARMLRFAGANTGFPIMSPGRDAARTAAYLAKHFGSALVPPARPAPPSVRAEITTYYLPEPADLPHDIAIDSTGAILVTGMMTHTMYVLDTARRSFSEVPIPVERANPRAVEIAPNGDRWVVLGGPRRLARYQPREKTWAITDVGVYAHSVAIDSAGNAWYNGHFTRDPEIVGVVRGSAAPEVFHAPAHPTMAKVPGGPIPYEIRSGPDGRLWMSELQGNRVLAFTPATRKWETFDMPRPASAPRRLDVGPDGRVWIPAYADDALYEFDPRTSAFKRHAMPERDAVPYIARFDSRRGVIWIGTNASDAIYSFDPRTSRFTRYALPEPGAVIRHLVIDPRNGDLWLAYGASPGIAARIERVRPGPA